MPKSKEEKNSNDGSVSMFDSLLKIPEGVDPQAFETELLNTYIGSKISQYFTDHGEPRAEELDAVTRTLRSLYIGQFAEEKQRWERTKNNKPTVRRRASSPRKR